MSAVVELLVLLLTPGLPLLVAFGLLARPGSRVLEVIGAWAALPGLCTSLLMPPGLTATIPWVLQGSEFGLDQTGRLFLFFSSALWLAAGVAARSWVTRRRGSFFVFFLLVMSGSLGLIISRDVLAFYLFFALMSFASYGLVAHDRSQRALYAGRIYMMFVLAGDMVLFAALVLIVRDSGGELAFETIRGVLPSGLNRDLGVALLILGLGVKVGVLGVHVTLPLIYAVAPTPAAVVLAGAMINAGLLGWLRLLPTGGGALPGWGGLLVVAGVAAAFYGALAGVLQRRARAVLAYSSISQMGIITMGVGVAVAASDGEGAAVAAVSVYALHHAFAKGSLFLGSGIARRAGGRHGLAVGLGLLLPALALTGAPLTTGMLAKEWLKHSLLVAPEPWQGALKALLPWMAFATTLVLARFLWLAWPTGRWRPPLQRGPLVVWVVLLGLTLSAAWLVPREPSLHLWSPSVIWEVSWPVLLGALASAAVALPAVHSRLPRWRAPPGDVLVVMKVLGVGLVRAWTVGARRVLPAARNMAAGSAAQVAAWPVWARAAAGAERGLEDWRVAITLFLLVILGFWALTLTG